MRLRLLHVLLFSFIAFICPLHAQEAKLNEANPDSTGALLKDIASTVKKNGWITIHDNNSLKAYRFSGDYNELEIIVHTSKKGSMCVYDVRMTKDGESKHRVFTTADARPPAASNLIMPYVMSGITGAHTNGAKSPYRNTFSFGYSRTNTENDLLPESDRGGYYVGLLIIYDPSFITGASDIPVRFGDYIKIDANIVIDSNPEGRNYINENFFNLDFIFWGRHILSGSAQNFIRSLFGLSMGMEYFRPGWKDNVLLWSHQLYHEQPHLQYLIYRAIGFSCNLLYSSGSGQYLFDFIAGAGPSINSSLFAVGLTPEEELNRSELFQSLTGSKQNFYYSACIPVSATVTADRLLRHLYVSLSYRFYFFYSADPAIDDTAHDIVHIVSPSIGVRVFNDFRFQAGYEYWRVESTLNGDVKSSSWKRLIFQISYCI